MFLYRLRFTLEITASVGRLHAIHWPTIYALLCEASGIGFKTRSFLPDGIIVLAPEQLRVSLSPGDRYVFGIDLLAGEAVVARQMLDRLLEGLNQIAAKAASPAATLGGNFRIAGIDDVYAGVPLGSDQLPTPLPAQTVLDEVQRVWGQRRFTLRFETPLRWQLPRSQRDQRNRYFDRKNFDAGVFLQRLPGRLNGLGLDTSGAPDNIDYDSARVLDNRLVWLDVDYRGARRKKMRLSGASGTVTLELPENYPVHWLVWSQYVHVGETTRFGFGSFRLEELGPNPYPCERSDSLLDLAVSSTSLDHAALHSGLDPAQARHLARQVVDSRYEPLPRHDMWLEEAGKEPRRLSIPAAQDRALQRAVLEMISPGLDDLFEVSSFAFRRGLGRTRAAQRIEELFGQGYRWAVHADFESFFDSIDHRELRTRLHAYIADPKLESLILKWIDVPDLPGLESSVSSTDRGIPTGAPLSPLLANLFLDQFDEQIEQAGGHLVRYADDFLILVKEESHAKAMFQAAQRSAENLALTLNDQKTRIVDLTEPFKFLGFEFRRGEDWHAENGREPVLVDLLGWHDASRRRPPHAPKFLLPNENDLPSPAVGSTCVLDGDVTWVGIKDGRIQAVRRDGTQHTGPMVETVEQMLIIGPATLDASLLSALRREQIALVLADSAGHSLLEWIPDQAAQTAELLRSQLKASDDDQTRLAVARQLVAAKLWNFAALAEVVTPRQPDPETAPRLRDFSMDALEAASVETLLGLEGAGAAMWYRSLPLRLPTRFDFHKRVSPRADDPVNVMLNIAHTNLYRQCRMAARLFGLAPAVGILHRPKSGHAALASDLQEPFRFLVERAVIETAWKCERNDFKEMESGPFALTMDHSARRQLLGRLHQSMASSCTGQGMSESFSFRTHLLRLARSLKTALLAGESDLNVFRAATQIAENQSSEV